MHDSYVTQVVVFNAIVYIANAAIFTWVIYIDCIVIFAINVTDSIPHPYQQFAACMLHCIYIYYTKLRLGLDFKLDFSNWWGLSSKSA